MCTIDSKLIRTDVTCVKIYNSNVLAGIGGQLHIFNIHSSNTIIIKVFDGQQIYGIKLDSTSKRCLIYGANQIKIFKSELGDNVLFEDVICSSCDDWILEADWIDNNQNIATLFMHNKIALWTHKMELIKHVICEERCLLYSACLLNNTWDELIVLSGTVFSQILIWWPGKGRTEELCPVLCRLDGHKGVIFSIDYNSKVGLICSTSDDRTAILWSVHLLSLILELQQPTIRITQKSLLYGHSARVFKCQVLDNCVLTAGEDSIINIWNLDGTLLRKFEGHQGGCIWSLDCDQQNNIIATGGGDCGITLFPLKQRIANHTISLKCVEAPKKICIMKNSGVLVVTEKGRLAYYCTTEKKWSEIGLHEDLTSYALLEASLCRNFVALAGYYGTVYIYKQFNSKIKLLHKHEIKDKARIYAFHWLNSTRYLTSSRDGLLSLWMMDESPVLLRTFELPPSKERWTTAACICSDECIAVGDRKGNLYLYSSQSEVPIQILRKAHNYQGITNLYFRNNELISMGRNAVLKRYYFDDAYANLSLSLTDKLPFTWLATLCDTCNTTLVMCFLGSYFVIWDYKTRRTLLQFDCGGGHRSWDFYKNNDQIYFAYIKDAQINLLQTSWDSIYPKEIISGYHISEINSACYINTSEPNTFFFVSGGEDTTLRISKLSFKNDCVNMTNDCILKSHLSSIRVVKSCKLGDDKYLVLSAGGRAQIILWEIQCSSDNLICKEKCSYYDRQKTEKTETRCMDLVTISIDDYIILIVACSDGTLKLFLIAECANENAYTMNLIGNITYKLKCILKIAYLNISCAHILLTMATDGKIVFWDLNQLLNKFSLSSNFQPFHSVQVHQSGINSFIHKIVADDLCVFLSGGDDNAVAVSLVKFASKNGALDVQVLSKFCDVASHCAQITGAYLTSDYFLTASIDQKLNLWKWKIENNELVCSYVQKHNSCVPDIQGMQCFETNGAVYSVLYGKGIEICRQI